MKQNHKIFLGILFWFLLVFMMPTQGLTDFCDPLPTNPADTVINVTPSQASQLPNIVYGAQSGTTILLADGTYSISPLQFHTANVTMRSKSGNRDSVILDGNYSTGEIVYISASQVTIADLTIRRALYHPVHVVGGGHYAMLYNLHLIDGKEQFVKVNPDSNGYTDYGTLACSFLEMTDAGRAYLQANPTPGFDCYTGGLDAHQSWGWSIRDNTVQGIYCTNGGLAEHGIHLWNSSREPTVERNRLINNARDIGFGLGSTGGQRVYDDNPLGGSGLTPTDVQHIGGTIRNNFIFANISQHDTGIGLEQAWNVNVYHNTILSTQGGLGIDVRFAHSNPIVKNNLISPGISQRDGGAPRESAANISASQSMFVNPTGGNLHLVSTATQAINKGVSLSGAVPTDIDGETRDSQPDAGADEFSQPDTPTAPANLRVR